MKWTIIDSKIKKDIDKLPKSIRIKYKFWKRLIEFNGLKPLRQLKSYHFEKLSGKRKKQYSCRLSNSYRIIFKIEKDKIRIIVLEVNKRLIDCRAGRLLIS